MDATLPCGDGQADVLMDILRHCGAGSPRRLIQYLAPTAALRLACSSAGMHNAIPLEVVSAHAVELYFKGAFPAPWLGGMHLAQALEMCVSEDADACFALLCRGVAEHAEMDEVESSLGLRCWPPLHTAAARDFMATTRLLLNMGDADLHCRDAFDGLAALDAAISAGSARTAHLLLDKGARPSQPQDALLVAITAPPDRLLGSVAQRLVGAYLADVDATIDLGVEYEDVEVVLRLLAFPQASDRRWVRQWALRRAVMLGDADLTERVLALPGVEVDDGTESSVGPALLLAAEAGNSEVCRRLLLHGANPCAARKLARGRWTATDLAALGGHEEVLRVLAAAGGPRAGEEPGGHPGAAAMLALGTALNAQRSC